MSTLHRRIHLVVMLTTLLAGTWTGDARCSENAPKLGGIPRLTFTKVLKGSVPEYTAITVDTNGKGTYDARKIADPPSPRAIQLSAAIAQRLFDLAKQLHYFQSIDLESHKRVANLGLKTFIYQSEEQTNRAEFNYTQNRSAQELTDMFERISTVEQHIEALEYAQRFDPLSLPHELLLIQIDLENQALVDPELMVPALEKIAQNPRFLHLAQSRAQDILRRIQGTN
jgi:hypothetical protein